MMCSGKGIYIEIFQGKTQCQTKYLDGKKGTLVSWKGTQLGNCLSKIFDTKKNVIHFRVKSIYTNDFCPKFLWINVVSARYESDQMKDWVDDTKGGHLRVAKKISGTGSHSALLHVSKSQ